jgi:hypothetical protein
MYVIHRNSAFGQVSQTRLDHTSHAAGFVERRHWTLFKAFWVLLRGVTTFYADIGTLLLL